MNFPEKNKNKVVLLTRIMHFSDNVHTKYSRGAQSCSWRSTVLHSSSQTLIKHTWS